MSATRKCAAKGCKTKISASNGEPKWCPDCLDPLESALKLPEFGPYKDGTSTSVIGSTLDYNAPTRLRGVKGLTQEIIDDYKDELQKLEDYNGPIPNLDSQMTLPTDSGARKKVPLMSGCLNYFPAALAGVAKISQLGNDKHNPGETMYHARAKSMDHGDCILRHLVDVQDLLAQDRRSALTHKGVTQLLEEVSQLTWRALALSQELHEKFGAPLAPGARE